MPPPPPLSPLRGCNPRGPSSDAPLFFGATGFGLPEGFAFIACGMPPIQSENLLSRP